MAIEIHAKILSHKINLAVFTVDPAAVGPLVGMDAVVGPTVGVDAVVGPTVGVVAVVGPPVGVVAEIGPPVGMVAEIGPTLGMIPAVGPAADVGKLVVGEATGPDENSGDVEFGLVPPFAHLQSVIRDGRKGQFSAGI
jgi:hypothetical protein